MRKILIFGNSGSGKSTLAKKLCEEEGLSHLDLDTIAWELSSPPTRKPLIETKQTIEKFVSSNDGWVIEGCYCDLLEIAEANSTEIIFMNLSVEACILNARSRPWEVHKYESNEAQDANLKMLITWISQYSKRKDSFSKAAHNLLYKNYLGKKRMFTNND